MFRRIAAAAQNIAASLTGAAWSRPLSAGVLTSLIPAPPPKFIYVFEATVEGLSEVGSTIDGTFTVHAAKDRPQWKQIDRPGQGVSFISPERRRVQCSGRVRRWRSANSRATVIPVGATRR